MNDLPIHERDRKFFWPLGPTTIPASRSSDFDDRAARRKAQVSDRQSTPGSVEQAVRDAPSSDAAAARIATTNIGRNQSGRVADNRRMNDAKFPTGSRSLIASADLLVGGGDDDKVVSCSEIEDAMKKTSKCVEAIEHLDSDCISAHEQSPRGAVSRWQEGLRQL